jgi:hypothetical protein
VDVDHRRVEVTSNGTAIPGPEIMVFVGSRLSMSGSMIRMGQFVIGLWVELSPTYERQMRHIVEDGGFKCYVLTATQEVFVNGLRIMPIGNKA